MIRQGKIQYDGGEKLRALFSTNLSKLLKSRKMTREELADEMGIKAGTVYNWTYPAGKTLPLPSLYERLCDTLDIGYWELLCEDFEEE